MTEYRQRVYGQYVWQRHEAITRLNALIESGAEAVKAGKTGSIPEYLLTARGFSGVAQSARIQPASDRVAEDFAFHERPGLVLELANVSLTPGGIQEFVTKHGLLGTDWHEGDDPEVVPFDTFANWLNQVIGLRRVLTVYRLLQGSDHDSLGKLFSVKPVGRKGKRYRICYQPADDWAHGDYGHERYIREDAPAQPTTQECAERYVRETVTSYLSSARGHRLVGSFELVTGSMRLIDEVWYQTAQAIADGRQYVPCAQCGKLCEVGGGTHRPMTDTIHCSNTCKVRAYRERKKTAVRLRQDGWTLRQIAKELNTTVATTSGWVDKVDTHRQPAVR